MNLFVANLNPDTKADSLKTLFSEFGEVVSAKVIFDPATGTSRGFGFVEMTDRFQSFAAIDNLDCSFFEGNIISVKEAKQNTSGGGNSRGGGGGNRPFNKNRPQQRPGGNPRYSNAPRPNWNNNNSGSNSGSGWNSNRDNQSSPRNTNNDQDYNRF